MLRSADDVGVGVLLAFQEQVGLADGIGLGVDLLPVQVGGDSLPALFCHFLESLFRDREHPTGSRAPS